MGLIGEDAGASITGLAEDFQPDKVAEPVNNGKEGEDEDTELGGLGGEGQSDGGPPEEKIGVSGGHQNAGDERAGAGVGGDQFDSSSRIAEHLDAEEQQEGSADRGDADSDVLDLQEPSDPGEDQKHEGKFDDAVPEGHDEAGMAVAGPGGEGGGRHGTRSHDAREGDRYGGNKKDGEGIQGSVERLAEYLFYITADSG